MAPIHANEVDRAGTAEGRKILAGLGEKRGESRPIHLSRSHREGAMVNRAETAGVTVDRHVVGRVGEHHCGAFLAHQGGEACGIAGIAAQDAVGTEKP